MCYWCAQLVYLLAQIAIGPQQVLQPQKSHAQIQTIRCRRVRILVYRLCFQNGRNASDDLRLPTIPTSNSQRDGLVLVHDSRRVGHPRHLPRGAAAILVCEIEGETYQAVEAVETE